MTKDDSRQLHEIIGDEPLITQTNHDVPAEVDRTLKEFVYDIGYQMMSTVRWSVCCPDFNQESGYLPEREWIKFDCGPFAAMTMNIGVGALVANQMYGQPVIGIITGAVLSAIQITGNYLRWFIHTDGDMGM